MDEVMTVDILYDMFVAEREDAFVKFCEYEVKEEKALAIGDHGTAAVCRKHAKQWEKRNKELTKILNEIYRMECNWRRDLA